MAKASGQFYHPRYSSIRKRSIVVDGRRTSISLEDRFWHSLRAIAYTGRVDLSALVSEIKANRGNSGLSSAIRQFILSHHLEQKYPSLPTAAPDLGEDQVC